jgi:hypothetical protein
VLLPLRGAEILRFENSGHGIFINAGDKLFEELIKFHEEEVSKKVSMQVAA